MTIARWKPPVAPTRQEQILLKRLDRVRKLLGFLRLHRHELFDEGLQGELASMYRTTGAGKDALPPAMMAYLADRMRSRRSCKAAACLPRSERHSHSVLEEPLRRL